MARTWTQAASRRALPSALTALLLSGCAHGPAELQDTPEVTAPRNLDLRRGMRSPNPPFIARPVPGRFTICHGHTCARITEVSLSAEQWAEVRAVFHPPADAAAEERERIRAAVALLERIVGAMTGTDRDKGRNRAGMGLPGQMDCVDESTNTSVYLTMMYGDGLLPHHRVGRRSSRGPFTLVMGMPHSTAVIEETPSGRLFAVDSWFLDNGEPPYVVPLREWRSGWEPPVP